MRRFFKRLKWRLLDSSRRQDCPASGIGVCPMEVRCMKGQPCCLKDSIATPGIEYDRRAAFPHCDLLVLHAPGECEYCDEYPDRQEERLRNNTNFTGQHDPEKYPCPSELRRTLETINRWPGNRPNPFDRYSPPCCPHGHKDWDECPECCH